MNDMLVYSDDQIISSDISELFQENIYIPSPTIMMEIFNEYKKNQEKTKLTPSEIKSLKVTRKQFECSICLNKRTRGVKLNCSHTFCKKCITTWLSDHVNNCPLCRCKIIINS